MQEGKRESTIIDIRHWQIQKLDNKLRAIIANGGGFVQQIEAIDRALQGKSNMHDHLQELRQDCVDRQEGLDKATRRLIFQLQEFPEDVRKAALAAQVQEKK